MKLLNAGIAIVFLMAILMGCNDTSTEKEVSKEKIIKSFEKIEVEGINPSLEPYKMTYMSEGKKVVAYVSVPKNPGSYYLTVGLHGGSYIPDDRSHVSSIGGILINKSMVADSITDYITLIPLYRGYGDSDGSVVALKGATIDTNNAIKALKQHFNNSNGEVKLQDGPISLSGTSLGGGVALKLAAERQDIFSVVAISPYVGADYVFPWAKAHKDTALGNEFYTNLQQKFGKFDKNSKKYQEQSIDYKNISAPVLILQGKEDDRVNWHPVEKFYQDMKAAHGLVTLKLFPDGNHGLSNKRQAVSAAINQWFKEKVNN